jgi:hypothetical protein
MKDYLPLVTVFLSGVFGLAVAIVTSILANRKDVRARQRQAAQETYEEFKAVYSGSLVCLEKCLRSVKDRADFPALQEELAAANARLQLIASDEVIEQNHKVGDLIFAWSTEFRQGEPKRSSGAGYSIISSQDTPHQEKAKELYPQLMKACNELAKLMREHLTSVRKRVQSV